MKDMTVMSLKIEKSVKEAGQKAAAALGMPFGTMITVLIKGVIHSNTLTVTYAEEPSDWLKNEIAEAKKDIANGDVISVSTEEELLAALSE